MLTTEYCSVHMYGSTITPGKEENTFSYIYEIKRVSTKTYEIKNQIDEIPTVQVLLSFTMNMKQKRKLKKAICFICRNRKFLNPLKLYIFVCSLYTVNFKSYWVEKMCPKNQPISSLPLLLTQQQVTEFYLII